MQESLEAIKALRLGKDIPIDRELDPNGIGIIGAEFSAITTSIGNPEAKRTSTNPSFAALMVKYFKEAGLEPGDAIAVGASGSFPALIVATLSACKALDLRPITIYSIGASTYGANIPDCTFVDMLAHLNSEGIIPYRLSAVSLGGEGDAGANALLETGRETMREIARRSGARFIEADSVAASIRARLSVYEEEAAGSPIECFVNVGGATPNYGATPASLDFPNGLVMHGPILSLGPERGLIFEFAARGIPVINLIDVRDLALKHGLPIDPVPIPPVGTGGVYYSTTYHKLPAGLALAFSLAVLAAGAWSTQERFTARPARPGQS